MIETRASLLYATKSRTLVEINLPNKVVERE